MKPVAAGYGVAALVAAVFAACIAYNSWCFGFAPLESDAVAYLYQARLFASGRIEAPAPATPALLPSPQINVGTRGAHSKYPPGNSLAIAAGVLVGAPWLVPAAASAGAVLVLLLVMREVSDRRTAFVAFGLAVMSPTTVIIGATWFSESVSRLCFGLFLLGLLRTATTGRVGWAIASGLALGWDFTTRPLTSVVLGPVVLATVAPRFRTIAAPARIGRLGLAFAVGALVAGAMTFAWNFRMTGSAFTPTFSLENPNDRLGFGLRGFGGTRTNVTTDRLAEFTPASALKRTFTRTIPLVLQNSIGVGVYDHRRYGLNVPQQPERAAALVGLLGLVVPAWLIVAGLRSTAGSFTFWLFSLISAGGILAYVPYFFDGAAFGFTPTNGRYYSEAIMFGVIPLVACGLVAAYDRLRLHGRQWHLIGAYALASLAIVSWGYNEVRFYRALSTRARFLREAARIMNELPSSHAVVFFSEVGFTPLGDKPEDLTAARVVPFRWTCLPTVAFTEPDLGEAHRRYFPDRDAFLLTASLELHRLTPSELAPGQTICRTVR